MWPASVLADKSSLNVITVLAEYLFATAGHDYTGWQLKGVAVAGYSVATISE